MNTTNPWLTRGLPIIAILIAGYGYWLLHDTPSPSIVHAQQGNTIYQKVLSNVISAPAYSSPVSSIGQSQHFLYVVAKDKSPTTCGNSNDPANLIRLEGSFDNITYFPLSSSYISNVSPNS